ncbi:uncharacterized protein LOC117328250 isoform X1 [Pecten maximus]|uniref:uncharacterized protein LOC117328250 isoform X1 n=1 Tax=Pecten maximus TaxID=6579 RepID=UPI0014583BEB|nr:uncharacterized protein LOC117328250 isoform X1 [Pecten maximus]
MVDVEVTFEYAAEQEDELNIKVGDIIKNVTMSEGGWWEGELNGKVGMFPDNFVKVIEKPKPTKVKEDPPPAVRKDKQRGASVRELASKIKDDVHVGIGAPKKKEAQPNAKRKRAKVVFSYEPENEDELKLEVGDIVDVLKQEEEGWWEGSLNGKVGMFPSNFAEEIEETDPERTPEEKPNEAPVEGKKKLIGGIGLGNIFEGGPIKLKSTSVKNTDKVTHSPPDPVVRRKEEESKPNTVTKREKHGLHVRPPIPTPRPSLVCSLTPYPSTSHTSDSNLEEGHSLHLPSDDNSRLDPEGRDGVKTQESWVNVLFGEQRSDDGTTNGEVQFIHVPDQESDEEENMREPATPGKVVSQQCPSYTILSGLDKLSVMQLMEQKDVTEENLIEYEDVEVDEENKENVMLGRKCVSAIASLGSEGSRTSFLGRVQHNANNNSVEEPKSQSKSVDGLEINIDMEKQNTDTSLKNSRIESWLSVEHQPPTVTSVAVASGKRKDSLFKRVMKLDMFRKRSKSVMPYNDKETEGKLTQTYDRQYVPSLTELCRITLKPYCSVRVRTPLKEITDSHVNQKQNLDQSGSFEVSVDSLDSAVGSLEAACEKKMNTIYQMYSDDDESLLSLLMGREDVGNDKLGDRVEEGAATETPNFKKGSALEDNLKRSDDLHDRIARDSYLGSLNRTGQLSPFIRMIASRYHLFDPETQKWKEGYMDRPEDLDLSASSSSGNLTAVNLTPNITAGERVSDSPVHEVDVALGTSGIEGDHQHNTSTLLSSYNVLPPGSVREKVLHYEHMYVNDLVDQVIEQTMHGLCLEQCLEELGSLGHHPELRHRLIKECSQYTGVSIPDCHRSEGEISPPGSELFTDGSEGEILTPKISDGEISSENEDDCAQPRGSHQKSLIEDSLYSGMTDGVDTDYATAMSDMDTDGSYVVSFLSNADLDVSIPQVNEHPAVTLNASGEYVDLPEQLSHRNDCYSRHSHPAVKPCVINK